MLLIHRFRLNLPAPTTNLVHNPQLKDSAVGILRVHVLKATNVDVANIAGGGAIANLYVVLGMGEQQHFRSKVL